MVTKQQLKLIKAKQKSTQLGFREFNVRLPTGQRVVTRTQPRLEKKR